MNIKKIMFSVDEKGQQPLWQIFWLYGVLLSHVYFGVILIAFEKVGPLTISLLLFGFVLYTLAIMRAIWINAFNTSKELYTYLARYLTIFWMMNSLLMSLYLFMIYFGFWSRLDLGLVGNVL